MAQLDLGVSDALVQLQRGKAAQRNRGKHHHDRNGDNGVEQPVYKANTPEDKVEPCQYPRDHLCTFHKLSLSLVFNRIESSCSCLSSIVPGASSITSRPLLFLGNAIKSRMLSLPPRIAQSRSNPKAMPPCGGAPYSKAPNRKPNLCCASSLLMPKAANIF